MNKTKNFLSTHKGWLAQMCLFLLACVTGGAGMCAAPVDVPIDYTGSDHVAPEIGHEGPGVNTSTVTPVNPGSDHDPVDPNTSDMLAPGGNVAGQDLTGTQLSSTQITKGGLLDDEWDERLVRFEPYNTPFLSLCRRLTQKKTVSNWVVNHMRVGGDLMEVVTTQPINGTSPYKSDTITLTSSNVRGSLKPFYKGSTVFALGVDGYAKGSNSVVDGELMLFVIDADKNSVVLMAVNGPARSNGVSGDELDYVQVPTIPAGTILSVGAVAGGESQMQITPENFQPRPYEVFVQKKIFNIVVTEDFEKVLKKRPLKFDDIKSDALRKFCMRTERSYWRGAKSRFNVQNADGSVEFAYTSEGILHQLTNSYAIDSEYTLMDLISISKLQFTDFASSNRAFVFCGKDSMAALLNINPGDNRRIIFNDVKEWDLDFKVFKTTFGSLYFIYDQTLDMLHMKDCMVVTDLDNAVRYVKETEREQFVDMSKGAGEVRRARRFIHTEADAIALRGFNSILVGPKETIFGLPKGHAMNEIVSSDSFPEVPSAGMKIALTEDYKLDDTTYTAGNVYVYDADDGWLEYTGLIMA